LDASDAPSQGPRQISRRQFVVGAGLAAVGAAIAACVPGSGSGSTTAPASAAAASTAPATAPVVGGSPSLAAAGSGLPDLTGQQGVLWGLKYDPHVAAYQRMADLFNQKTGAKLTVQPIDPGAAGPPGTLAQQFLAAIAAGNQPDVMCLYGPAAVPLYVQKALMPLKQSVYAAQGIDVSTAFVGDAMPSWIWQGEYYGVPVECNGVGSMVNVPVDDVKALGLDTQYPPSNGKTFFDSYDALYKLAGALQKKSGSTVTRWGLSSKAFELESLAGIMASLGTKWWDGDAKVFNFNSPDGITAFQMLVETPVKMGIETELDQSATQAALAGKVALSRGDGGPSVVGAAAGFNFELAGAPRVKPGEDPVLIGGGGWGFMAPRNAKNPDLSVAFLKFVASDDGQLAYAKIYDGLLNFSWAKFATDTSRFKDASSSNAIFRAAPAFTAMALRTKHFGEGFGYYAECEKAAGDVCSLVRQGTMTSAAGAAELQKRVEAQYAQFVKDVAAAG
jgi:ABC-type glycerol-3-phosphate transport system substrate-binding protein